MAIGIKMKQAARKSNLRNAYSAYQRRTQGMGSSARVNSRPLQQKSTRSIGMTEPTPRSAGSGYTQKVASKAYLKTARNGGEEGKENAQNRTGRIARNNTYTSFVQSRTGKNLRLSGRGKRITSANKALLDRYNRGK